MPSAQTILTMQIEKISQEADRAGRYRVTFTDGTFMRLYRQTVEDFGLYSGMELSEDAVSELRTAAGKMSARMRAVRIVAASNVSRRDLEQRLIQKGESASQAKEAVAWMQELNLVDDRRTAEQLVQGCIRKGYGMARAKQILYEKKIPKAIWEEVLAGYPDQTEHILRFLEDRLGDDWEPKDLKRAVDALLRKGHGYGQIREALSRLQVDDEFPEEV